MCARRGEWSSHTGLRHYRWSVRQHVAKRSGRSGGIISSFCLNQRKVVSLGTGQCNDSADAKRRLPATVACDSGVEDR